ncbi:MAG: prepilin-type N-terminal cleavage/methylation domain-containing protein [Alphaproteobacteria bacterium]|nr:prepilin-type N-terminal cleavage/methylation domain-containing protein [Alphaproteobacteria bacterium]
MRRHGFSLVELSIVLVIMGLIVGGIMAGASVIRNTEVKTVITEYNQYKQAVLTFRGKYAALPGDIPDAASYWSGAVNGDGDGLIEWAAAANGTGEFVQFWRHLSLAGEIEGQYTGLAGSGGPRHVVPGTNAPKSTITNGGWGAFFQDMSAGDADNFAINYGNVMVLGGEIATNWNWNMVLNPEEAWNIDMKIDDGMPGAGSIIATNRTSCANSTSVADYAATYQLSQKNKICSLYFVRINE